MLMISTRIPAQVTFSDNFAGTIINTANWITYNVNSSGVTQNGALLLAGTMTTDKPGWDQCYALSAPSFNRTYNGKVLRLTVNEAFLDGLNLIGLYPAGVFNGWNSSPDPLKYAWQHIPKTGYLYPLQNNDFSVYKTGVASGNLILRITLDPNQGALWEYDLNDGNGWRTARDTRGASGGDASSSYQLAIEYCSEQMISNPCLELSGVIVEYVDEFQTDFTGATINTDNWGTYAVNGGYVFQDGALVLGGSTITNEPNWDQCYVSSGPSFSRTMNGKVLRFTITEEYLDGLTLIGLYPTGTFTGWSLFKYGWHHLPELGHLYPIQNNDFSVFDSGIGYGELVLRITLDPVQGALWEYSLNNGTSWQTARDTRGVSGGDTSSSYQLAAEYCSEQMISACQLCLNNVTMEYIDPFQDNFAGTTVNTGRWTTHAANGGSISQNNSLQMAGTAYQEPYLDQCYVTSDLSFNRTNNGQVLQVIVTEASLDGLSLIGLYPTGSFTGWSLFKFCWNHIPITGTESLYPIQNNDFTVQVPDVPDEDLSLRITLDPVKGALWEINQNDGREWVKVRDTRGISGDASSSYQLAIEYIDQNVYVNPLLCLSNVTVGYVDNVPATQAPTPAGAASDTLISESWINGTIDTTIWNVTQGSGSASIVNVGGTNNALKMSNSGTYNTTIYSVKQFSRGENLTCYFTVFHDNQAMNYTGFMGPFHFTNSSSLNMAQTIECGFDRYEGPGAGSNELRWSEGAAFVENGPELSSAFNTAWANASSLSSALTIAVQLGNSTGGRAWYYSGGSLVPITSSTGDTLDTTQWAPFMNWKGYTNIAVSSNQYVYVGFGPNYNNPSIYLTNIQLFSGPVAAPAPMTVIPNTDLLMPAGTMEYNQTVPYTLDLGERARMALHGLTESLNMPDYDSGSSCQYTNFDFVHYYYNPPVMNLNNASQGSPNWGKHVNSMILMRRMCGDTMDTTDSRTLNLQLLSTQNMLNPYYSPCMSHSASVQQARAWWALMNLYDQNEYAALQTMIDDMGRGARCAGNYNLSSAYGFWPPPQTYVPFDSSSGSHVWGGWGGDMFGYGTGMWAMSQYASQYIDNVDPWPAQYVGESAQYFMKYLSDCTGHTPPYWPCNDGCGRPFQNVPHFHGGPHGYLMALNGMAAAIALNPEANGWLTSLVNSEYLFVRDYIGIGRIGLFGESCALGNMISLAVQLSEMGVADYWDDVDLYVRNQLAEIQMTEDKQSRLQSYLNLIPPSNETINSAMQTTNDVVARNRGLFITGCSYPTRYCYIPGNSNVEVGWNACCQGNVPLGMYMAWDGIVQYYNNCAVVNLLLNRSSKWCDIDSYLPYEGKVVIHLKNGTPALSVRMPEWVTTSQVVGTVNGTVVSNTWSGKYLCFTNLAGTETIQITMPTYSWQKSKTLSAMILVDRISH